MIKSTYMTDNKTNEQELANLLRLKSQRTEGWVSVAMNLILFGLKFWAGLFTGSIAITADAWHTLTDSVSSVAVILSARLSSRPPDREHPFGHGRYELIAALSISFLLFIIAYGFIREAWERFNLREGVTYGTVAIVVTIISVLSKELLARYAFRLGKKTDSDVLKADGWHHRSDAISSAVILAGIFAGKHLWWIDSALAVIVGLLIAYAAWQIARNAMNSILGQPIKPEMEESIRKIGTSISSKVTDIHHFHFHNYISHSEITFHLRLPDLMPIAEAHEIADAIEKEVRIRYGIEATIHIEPIKEGRHEKGRGREKS
jgi:cation diffusion facilitator family transporter